MTDPDASDDSSAASSGDELLKFDVGFTQESCTTKGSDSDNSPGKGGKGKAQGEPKATSKKRKHEEAAAKSMDPEEMEERERAFKISFIGKKVGAPDKLRWLEKSKKSSSSKKSKKMIHPVRVVPIEETAGMDGLKRLTAGKVYVQDIQYPKKGIKGVGLYYDASERALSPYFGTGEDRGRWCPIQMGKYLKQYKSSHKGLTELDLKTEAAFLQCALQQSIDEGKDEEQLAELDEAGSEDPATTQEEKRQPEEESDDDEDETVGTKRSTRSGVSGKQTTECLRKGDVIEYYNPMSVFGDERGLCSSTILAINPKADRILTLDDAMMTLLPDHRVKRIKICGRGGILRDNPNGEYRSIDSYSLKKEGDPNALKNQLAKEAAAARGIIDRAKEQAVAKMEKDGINASLARDMMR